MIDKRDEPFKKAEERKPFSPAVSHEPTSEKVDLTDRGPNAPAGLKREAVKPLEERASGESGRKNQVEENPHKQDEVKDGQPKEREFSGDVRRPGSPDAT